ncbi:MAG: deoxyribodipyrimidine photolyase-related protein [Francisellaceae bacterium]|jgi:deoxyribodipyrimidine photolyase-related protein
MGDQLSHSLASFQRIDPQRDTVLIVEVMEEATYVKHHKKKIILIFSAMRHFAQELTAKGFQVKYIKLTDDANPGSFQKALQQENNYAQLQEKQPYKEWVITHPGEYRVLKNIQHLAKDQNMKLTVLRDDRFLSTPDEFSQWATRYKSLRMEYFYRTMRLKHNILMDYKKPEGGEWNYDSMNRKPPKNGLKIPKPFSIKIDGITKEIIKLINEKFSDHFGSSENFHFAIDREGAIQALEHFIQYSLPTFGDYQDAMIEGEDWMYHSHVSFYLNIGLLLPAECLQAAEKAYRDKHAPLHAVEGFIRQILGWREFIRGVYWLKMPGYKELNELNAKHKLPDFFWSTKTKMNCLKQSLNNTYENAYAHHIQRLMVIGNFCLLAGIDPKDVNEWFLIVYADAFEWVELPNVSGMSQFSDGGLFASKPYISSGAYINRMSNYCQGCYYKVKEKSGKNACPFNYLYWNFIATHQPLFTKNPRMRMMVSSYQKTTTEKKLQITKDAKYFLDNINDA